MKLTKGLLSLIGFGLIGISSVYSTPKDDVVLAAQFVVSDTQTFIDTIRDNEELVYVRNLASDLVSRASTVRDFLYRGRTPAQVQASQDQMMQAYIRLRFSMFASAAYLAKAGEDSAAFQQWDSIAWRKWNFRGEWKHYGGQ